MKELDPASVRPAFFADDQWYPSSAAALRSTIQSLLAAAKYRDLGRPLGLICPHAGLRFSGAVAAEAYRQLEGQSYELVAAVSPVHRRLVGPYAVTSYRYYSTPLGLLPVAEWAVAALVDRLPVSRIGRDEEHSLEIQLPFLQVVLGEFVLLPIMMGDQSAESCRLLAQALAEVLQGRSALVVASSDLSHFHPYEVAVRIDSRIAERVANFDPEGLAADLAAGRAEACGGGPMVATMLACKALGAKKAFVLQYANSGDVWQDRTSVVGYLAAALV